MEVHIVVVVEMSETGLEALTVVTVFGRGEVVGRRGLDESGDGGHQRE